MLLISASAQKRQAEHATAGLVIPVSTNSLIVLVSLSTRHTYIKNNRGADALWNLE